ncbi:hypothetical protein ACN28S_47805 [Cystobacter fuscus]
MSAWPASWTNTVTETMPIQASATSSAVEVWPGPFASWSSR